MLRALLLTAGIAVLGVPLWAAAWGQGAKYSHAHPKHVALECGSCHKIKSGELDLHEFPGHATCVECHNLAADVMNRAEAFCGECHKSAEPSKDRPELFEFPRKHRQPDFGIHFSHPAHRKAGLASLCAGGGSAQESRCMDCHVAVKGAASEMTKEASHKSCFACHCETPRGYAAQARNLNPSRNDCGVCHRAGAGPAPPSPKIAEFRHIDHRLDTRPRRKVLARVSRAADALCIECHRSAADAAHRSDIQWPRAMVCQDCHTGKPGLPEPLPETMLRRLP